MVVESSRAWLELHDPFIGVHLEHSATIFAVVHHSMTLLCSVEQKHIGNSIGTMLHRNAPEVSLKHAAGTPVSDFWRKHVELVMYARYWTHRTPIPSPTLSSTLKIMLEKALIDFSCKIIVFGHNVASQRDCAFQLELGDRFILHES